MEQALCLKMPYTKSLQNFAVKDQMVHILGSVGHILPVTTIWFCHYSIKAAANSVSMNGSGSVPKNLYLQR